MVNRRCIVYKPPQLRPEVTGIHSGTSRKYNFDFMSILFKLIQFKFLAGKWTSIKNIGTCSAHLFCIYFRSRSNNCISSNTWGPSSGLLRLFVNKKSTYSLFGVYGESKSTFEFSFQLFLIISGYNYLFHLQAVRVNISWLSCCEKALPSW